MVLSMDPAICQMLEPPFTCYYSHPQLVYYFAKAGTGTYHCVYGPLTVNAYKARDSNKPSVSVNVQPWKVGTTHIDKGKILTKYEVETPNLPENLKIKLIAYLFMMKHWGQESAYGIQLNYQLGNQDSLAESIFMILQQLREAKLLDENAPAAIRRQEVILTAGSARPGLTQQLHEYIVNDVYPTDILKHRDDSWFEEKFNFTQASP